MPAIMPVPPEIFKAILERDGWVVVEENRFVWVLDHDDFDEPCILPKDTDLVAVDLMMSLFRRAGWSLTAYFDVIADKRETFPFDQPFK